MPGRQPCWAAGIRADFVAVGAEVDVVELIEQAAAVPVQLSRCYVLAVTCHSVRFNCYWSGLVQSAAARDPAAPRVYV